MTDFYVKQSDIDHVCASIFRKNMLRQQFLFSIIVPLELRFVSKMKKYCKLPTCLVNIVDEYFSACVVDICCYGIDTSIVREIRFSFDKIIPENATTNNKICNMQFVQDTLTSTIHYDQTGYGHLVPRIPTYKWSNCNTYYAPVSKYIPDVETFTSSLHVHYVVIAIYFAIERSLAKI